MASYFPDCDESQAVADTAGTLLESVDIVLDPQPIVDDPVLIGVILKAIQDSMTFTDSSTWTVTVVAELVERIRSADEAPVRASFYNSESDSLATSDLAGFLVELLCSDATTSADVCSALQNHKPSLLEILIAVDQANTQSSMVVNTIDALELLDEVLNLYGVGVIETASLADSIDLVKELFSYCLESVSAVATADLGLTLMVFGRSTAVTSDNSNVTAILDLIISDAVTTIGQMSLDDEHYTFVMNTYTKGVSEYTNFNFNSMSGSLAASSDGIFEIDGSDDSGTAIEAAIKTGFFDFGEGLHSQVPYAYLGMSKDGSIILKTVTDLNGERKERWYKTSNRVIADTDTVKLKLGKGIKSRYWQFEITNVDGTDFDLSTFEPMPLKLKRKV